MVQTVSIFFYKLHSSFKPAWIFEDLGCVLPIICETFDIGIGAPFQRQEVSSNKVNTS